MNTTIISGNIGSVKEVVTVGSSKVLNFSVAVNKHFTKNNEKVTETIWYECSLWNRENIYPFLKPGTNVLVQGEVGARAYADTKNDNKPIAVLTCSVETIEFWNKQDGAKE